MTRGNISTRGIKILSKPLKITAFGLMVWLIPTIVTYITSLTSGLYLFDVISALSIAISVIVFTYLYFKGIDSHFIKEGIIIGVVWLIMSVILDIILILLGVTKLSLLEYAIFVTPLYIIIPVVTIGFGLYKDQVSSEGIP